MLPVGQAISRESTRPTSTSFYVQDSWRLGSNLTVTAGVRYGLYSPPYEVNGLQVAPTISMGEWFQQRAEGMLRGVPSNQSPHRHVRSRRPEERRQGLLRMGQEQLCAARRGRVDTARDETGFLGWLTGGDKMVVRGGYSKVFDRIGQGIALNFDQGFAFGMSTLDQQPVRLAPTKQNPAVRFVDTSTSAADVAGGAAWRVPADAADQRAGIITTSIDDTLVTPSAHMVNALIGARAARRNFAIEGGYVGRFGRDLLIRRDLAMPLNLVDTSSGMDYFTAAQTLIRATQAAGIPAGAAFRLLGVVPNMPYWENLFPGAASDGISATQAIARAFNRDAPGLHHDALAGWTSRASPGVQHLRSLLRTSPTSTTRWRSISSLGRSNYHAMIMTLRKRYSQRLPVRPELHAVGLEGHRIERRARQRLRQFRRRRLLRVPHQLLRPGGELRDLGLRHPAPGQLQLGSSTCRSASPASSARMRRASSTSSSATGRSPA